MHFQSHFTCDWVVHFANGVQWVAGQRDAHELSQGYSEHANGMEIEFDDYEEFTRWEHRLENQRYAHMGVDMGSYTMAPGTTQMPPPSVNIIAGLNATLDMLTEEIWEMQSKIPVLDFNQLKRLAFKKAKQIFVDIINDDISVADRQN